MKYINSWACASLFIFASLMMSACGSDKEDDEPENPSSASYSGIVKFSAEIPALSEDGQSPNQQDYVFWVCAMESKYGSAVSLTSTPTFRGIGYVWNSSEHLYVPASTSIAKADSQKFCYYISSSPILDYEELPVFAGYAAENQTADVDFIYSDKLVGKTAAENRVVFDVNLRHVFSRLQIECEGSMGTVYSITLKNVKIGADINLNYQTASTKMNYERDVVMHQVKGKSNVFEAILPPQTFGSTDVLAEIITSSGEYSWTPSESFTLKSNQYIEYTLRDSEGNSGSGSGNVVGFSGSIVEWQDN